MATTYSTGEAAEEIGVSRQTLQAWIDKKRVAAPKLVRVGGVSVRLWTKADLERIREFKTTTKAGRRKKKTGK